jgi:hypothetical protein
LADGQRLGSWFAVQLLIQAGWTNVVFHYFVIATIVTAMWAPQHLKLWRRYRDTGHLSFEETDHWSGHASQTIRWPAAYHSSDLGP